MDEDMRLCPCIAHVCLDRIVPLWLSMFMNMNEWLSDEHVLYA